MGKISYEDKMQIRTFHEISFGYWTIVTNIHQKGWKFSSEKKQSAYHFSLAS